MIMLFFFFNYYTVTPFVINVSIKCQLFSLMTYTSATWQTYA